MDQKVKNIISQFVIPQGDMQAGAYGNGHINDTQCVTVDTAEGMVKKGLEWLVVLICVYVGEALRMEGIGGAALTYMIATELVSLMENLSIFGLSVPALDRLLDVAQGDRADEKEEGKGGTEQTTE